VVPPCSDRISRVPPYSRTCATLTRTGLSPAMAARSSAFRFGHTGHWPSPRSLVTTNGVSVDVLSSGYLDISVHRVRFHDLWIQSWMTFRPGFPIRISADQSSLAAPHGFSQRVTSFIASRRQGIHRMPFLTLDRPLQKQASDRHRHGPRHPDEPPGTARRTGNATNTHSTS
jgi:hypothetical protein